jgi:hypothetical protein
MDKASAYGAGDCRFESCRGHCDCMQHPKNLRIGILSDISTGLDSSTPSSQFTALFALHNLDPSMAHVV